MAKASKRTAPAAAPMAPVENQAISLDMVALVSASEPGFMYVPTDVSAAWVQAGFVETNPAMTDATGAVATRITEKGKQSLMETPATPAASASNFIRAVRPALVAKRSPVATNAAKYPFDELVAPTTDANGNVGQDMFFVPATAERPNPAKTLASTVSTAKDRYSRVTGEREYKAKEAVKNEDGSPVLDANGQPVTKEVTKKRAVKEYDREFRIEAGEAVLADGTTVKGAWVARTK